MRIVGIERTDGEVEVLSDDGVEACPIAAVTDFWSDPTTYIALAHDPSGESPHGRRVTGSRDAPLVQSTEGSAAQSRYLSEYTH